MTLTSLSREVQHNVAATQVQLDSESVTTGFNAGNVIDMDDALASAVGGGWEKHVPKLLQVIEAEPYYSLAVVIG
ncbi:hypothetical protein RIF29_03974 [Crotalaria pallida]|uniref:Uncharacterized protein n=1 Tax=Crotalaria pallida TaxID=3830 RepID=A0AAN9J0K2_CROPI